MKWIKASERMPDHWAGKSVRFIHTKIPLMDAKVHLSYHPESTTVIEWLDETPPSNDIVGEGKADGVEVKDYAILQTIEYLKNFVPQWREAEHVIYNTLINAQSTPPVKVDEGNKADEDDGWIYCPNCGRVKEAV